MTALRSLIVPALVLLAPATAAPFQGEQGLPEWLASTDDEPTRESIRDAIEIHDSRLVRRALEAPGPVAMRWPLLSTAHREQVLRALREAPLESARDLACRLVFEGVPEATTWAVENAPPGDRIRYEVIAGRHDDILFGTRGDAPLPTSWVASCIATDGPARDSAIALSEELGIEESLPTVTEVLDELDPLAFDAAARFLAKIDGEGKAATRCLELVGALDLADRIAPLTALAGAEAASVRRIAWVRLGQAVAALAGSDDPRILGGVEYDLAAAIDMVGPHAGDAVLHSIAELLRSNPTAHFAPAAATVLVRAGGDHRATAASSAEFAPDAYVRALSTTSRDSGDPSVVAEIERAANEHGADTFEVARALVAIGGEAAMEAARARMELVDRPWQRSALLDLIEPVALDQVIETAIESGLLDPESEADVRAEVSRRAEALGGEPVPPFQVFDVLARPMHFDVETGMLPVGHDLLLQRLLVHAGLDAELGPTLEKSRDPDDVEGGYLLTSIVGERFYFAYMRYLDDWYDLEHALFLSNTIARDLEREERFIQIDTGDQMAMIAFARPEALEPVAALCRVELAADPNAPMREGKAAEERVLREFGGELNDR